MYINNYNIGQCKQSDSMGSKEEKAMGGPSERLHAGGWIWVRPWEMDRTLSQGHGEGAEAQAKW